MAQGRGLLTPTVVVLDPACPRCLLEAYFPSSPTLVPAGLLAAQARRPIAMPPKVLQDTDTIRLADGGTETAQEGRSVKGQAAMHDEKEGASPKVAVPTVDGLQTAMEVHATAMAQAGITTVAISAAEMAEPGVTPEAQPRENASSVTPPTERLSRLPFG